MDEFDFSKFALASGEELNSTSFPRLDNVSAAFLYKFIPRPQKLSLPEFVYVPFFHEEKLLDDYHTKAIITITEWNALWEAGQLRPDILPRTHYFPHEFNWLKKYNGKNLYLIPGGRNMKYDAYVPLYHLVHHRTLLMHNMPSFKRGLWPPWAAPNFALEQFIGPDFGNRLSDAFAWQIWPLIDTGSRITAFSKDYPLRLLAHNLNFWLPYAVLAIEKRLEKFGFVPFEKDRQRDELKTIRTRMPSSVRAGRPRCGGTIWAGEEEAWGMAKEIVELSDRQGKLRAIIDAVRTNRVEDDFSEKWSYAKEDFERKIYHKRSKVKVTFVELHETIPVHGATSEVDENLIWEDFIALLNVKEKRIVICLKNGVTRVGDIAKSLGYANHCPVSKALSRIRLKARAYLNL